MEYALLGFLFALLLCWAVYIFFIIPAHNRRISDLEMENNLAKKASTSKSRSTIKGQLAEQLYPLLPGCAYIPSDMRFIGSPIDYLIIDGYTDAKDDGGEIKSIILADIKQGSAQLSRHQRKIKEAVEAGRVEWRTIRISPDYEVT